MRAESGAQEKVVTAVLESVSFSASPPNAGMIQTWALGPSGPVSPRGDRNASHWPSGDQRGLVSSGPAEKRRALPPSYATTQISVLVLLSLRSARATVYAI